MKMRIFLFMSLGVVLLGAGCNVSSVSKIGIPKEQDIMRGGYLDKKTPEKKAVVTTTEATSNPGLVVSSSVKAVATTSKK